MTAWRVGEHYGIHVYEGDRPVATFLREEDARRCVEAIADNSNPRPLYVNHDRAEPAPGDVVRDADDDNDARTWMYRFGNELAWIRTVRHYGESQAGKLIDAHERREHLPRRLRLLVDGETGQVVP